MSGIPPRLFAEPGTPAGEWAVQTTSALDPHPETSANATSMNPTTAQLFEEKNMRPGAVAEETFTYPSTVSTPGREFPGAYPDNKEANPAGSEIVSTVTDTAQRVAQSVTQTAQTYGPIAAETIGQYLPKSLADKMSEYTGVPNPQGTVIASEHDAAHVKSLPSTELTGAGVGEHVGGVGALPGTIAESSVTKLPEERNTSAEYPTVAGATVIAKEKAQGAAQTLQATAENAKNRATGNTHSTAVTGSTLPTQEWEGAKPGDHSSGIGALPGPVNEPAVALLPDEGGRGITNATSASVGTHPRSYGSATLPSLDDSRHGVSGGVGALPGSKDESSVALLPDERSAQNTGFGPKQDAEFAGAGAAAAGMGQWALKDKDQARSGLNPKTGEDTAMADAARAVGVKHTDTEKVEPKQQTKQESKQEGKAGAATIGAAVGEQVVKNENTKDQAKSEKPSHAKNTGKPNQEEHEEKQANLRRVQLNPRAHVLGSKGARWAGISIGSDSYRHGTGVDIAEEGDYDTDYHPARLHPIGSAVSKDEKEHAEEEQTKEPPAEKDQEKPLNGAKHADSKQASHASGTGSATDHDDDDHDEKGQKAKKAGFMAKMKGEALVLLGKVEGKKGHDKVEQGQKLKAGESVPSQ